VSAPTFAQNAKMGHPSVWFGEKEPCEEILRWESPALPETPPPQDEVNFPTLTSECATLVGHPLVPFIRWRLCGTQGPSTALRFGRDDRVIFATVRMTGLFRYRHGSG
jgi:hypothetical protein